ncbi:MAG: tetratricopeptide repeat protein [Terriglobales bacterium]
MEKQNYGSGVTRISMTGDEGLKFLDGLQSQRDARDLVNEGAALFQAGDYSAAEDKFKQAIKANPKNEVAHANIGNIYFKRKHYDEAVPWLEKALALNPDVQGVRECIRECKARTLVGPPTNPSPHNQPRINALGWVFISLFFGVGLLFFVWGEITSLTRGWSYDGGAGALGVGIGAAMIARTIWLLVSNANARNRGSSPPSRSAPTSPSTILAAKKSLSPSQGCEILYFSNAEQRDKAYQILMSQFTSRFQHIERRSVTNRQVMYEHWIVVGDTRAYNLEMQEVLKKAGCVDREEQLVDYRTVLADSEPA